MTILSFLHGDDVEFENVSESSVLLVLNITEKVGGCMYSHGGVNIM